MVLCALIVGTFLVRTWRVGRSGELAAPDGQYILDRIEVDDGFLRYGRRVGSFESRGETFASVTRRFEEVTGIPVKVRWESLARIGVSPQTPAPLFVAVDEKPLSVVRSMWDACMVG